MGLYACILRLFEGRWSLEGGIRRTGGDEGVIEDDGGRSRLPVVNRKDLNDLIVIGSGGTSCVYFGGGFIVV